MSDVCALCTMINNQILKNFSKEMFLSLFTIKIFLAIEMFKVFKGISPHIMKEIFQFRDAMLYELRKQTDFQIPFVQSVFSSTESIKFL